MTVTAVLVSCVCACARVCVWEREDWWTINERCYTLRMVEGWWGRNGGFPSGRPGCLAINFYSATVCPCHIEYYYYYYYCSSIAGGLRILLLCVCVVQLKTSLNTPGYKLQTFYCAWNPCFIILFFTYWISLFFMRNVLPISNYAFHRSH